MRLVDDIDVIKNCEPIFKNKIVLYGAGFCGKKTATMLRKLKIPVEAVCTTTRAERSLVKGVRHISVSELKEMDDRQNLLIVIATIVGKFMEQILENLDQHKILRGKRITYLGLSYACVLNQRIDKDGRLAFERNLWRIGYEESIKSVGDHELWKGLSNEAVWVYAPMKVGGTTLSNSLEKCGVLNAHVHKMEREQIRRGPQRYMDGRITVSGRCFEDYEMFLGQLKAQENLRIITAVREPIARDISRFFQSFTLPYTKWADQTNDIYADFIKMAKGCYERKENIFEWFNDEIKQVFEVDIYKYPFDCEKGYAVIEKGNISILVLKLEKLNALESVIGKFVQAEDFQLVNANEAKDKPYRYMYEEFKQNVKLPQSYVDSYYKGNPYMDHFYSEEEKEGFLEKWRKHIW